MAIPMIVLYEVGILVSKLASRKKDDAGSDQPQ